MRLKNISVSETNYQVLKDLGRAGESFNDVISELIARVLVADPKIGYRCKKTSLSEV